MRQFCFEYFKNAMSPSRGISERCHRTASKVCSSKQHTVYDSHLRYPGGRAFHLLSYYRSTQMRCECRITRLCAEFYASPMGLFCNDTDLKEQNMTQKQTKGYVCSHTDCSAFNTKYTEMYLLYMIAGGAFVGSIRVNQVGFRIEYLPFFFKFRTF